MGYVSQSSHLMILLVYYDIGHVNINIHLASFIWLVELGKDNNFWDSHT